jgi:hypothetical protein
MRVRTKLATDQLPECLIVSADNPEEREKLREVYGVVLNIISTLSGRPVMPYDNVSQKVKKIAKSKTTEIKPINGKTKRNPH